MAELQFDYLIFIRATPERVWRALTDPAETRCYWYGRRYESDWQEGSPIVVWDNARGLYATGIVLKAKPFELLSYSWHVEHDIKARLEGPSRAILTLAPVGDCTRLAVQHRDIEKKHKQLPREVSEGWPTVLSSLKSYVETGTPLTELTGAG